MLIEAKDPLGYDRLVRRFQTAAEREAEGKKKGYSGVLEADLWRSEAKMEALRRVVEEEGGDGVGYVRGSDGEILVEEEKEEEGGPLTREEGMRRWKGEMERRFLRGGDVDFEYGVVDEGEEFDGEEEREREERWFDEEEATFLLDGGKGEEDDDDGGRGKVEGETGVQDF